MHFSGSTTFAGMLGFENAHEKMHLFESVFASGTLEQVKIEAVFHQILVSFGIFEHNTHSRTKQTG